MILYFSLLLENTNKIKYMCISIRAFLIFILTNAPFLLVLNLKSLKHQLVVEWGKTYEMEELKQ
jgi:hypothetical protein